MDLQYDLLDDIQQNFAELADRLTLGHARECQVNVVGLLWLLIEWKSGARGRQLSSASTTRMQSRSSHLAIASRPRVWVRRTSKVRVVMHCSSI